MGDPKEKQREPPPRPEENTDLEDAEANESSTARGEQRPPDDS
jgi:hypothetical protein